jgi:hypothetical protein
MLRERYGAGPDFRPADYFDMIGGTSAGAVIATARCVCGVNVQW